MSAIGGLHTPGFDASKALHMDSVREMIDHGYIGYMEPLTEQELVSVIGKLEAALRVLESDGSMDHAELREKVEIAEIIERVRFRVAYMKLRQKRGFFEEKLYITARGRKYITDGVNPLWKAILNHIPELDEPMVVSTPHSGDPKKTTNNHSGPLTGDINPRTEQGAIESHNGSRHS